jgi:hypothetical protein
MAKIYTERAYIEAHDEEEDNFSILIHIKRDVEHIFVGKVILDHQIAWIHMQNAENGDLLINNSAGMEGKKWDHITKEIIGEIHG